MKPRYPLVVFLYFLVGCCRWLNLNASSLLWELRRNSGEEGRRRKNCVRAPVMKWVRRPPLLPWACGAPGPGRTGCGGWAQRHPGNGSTVWPAGSRAGSRPCWSAPPLSHGPPAADGDRLWVRMDTLRNATRWPSSLIISSETRLKCCFSTFQF